MPQNISKKSLIIVAVFVIIVVIIGIYFYENGGMGASHGLTDQERQAFVSYTAQYQKDHPTPTVTPKEQQAFVQYENDQIGSSGTTPSSTATNTTTTNTTTAKKPSNTTSSPTPTPPVQTLTPEQQAFIKYMQSQMK